jgi:SecD/SecF fusion protein
VAALLTILGYSLYDTIIVFDRVRENVPRMPRAAFSQIVNRSMSEVLTRSLATSFCTLLPVLSLLLFGGETLKDFAFALLVGVASGAYSSIFIASPVLTHWKEREGVYRNRRVRLQREFGYVPAYATSLGDVAVDGEDAAAARTRGRGRKGSLLTPEEPGEQISKEEFDELVRDLDIEPGQEGRPAAAAGARGRAERGANARRGQGAAQRQSAPPRSTPPSASPRPPAAPSDPTADAQPEDVVMPQRREGDGAGKAGKPRKPRNRRHGRAR